MCRHIIQNRLDHYDCDMKMMFKSCAGRDTLIPLARDSLRDGRRPPSTPPPADLTPSFAQRVPTHYWVWSLSEGARNRFSDSELTGSISELPSLAQDRVWCPAKESGSPSKSSVSRSRRRHRPGPEPRPLCSRSVCPTETGSEVLLVLCSSRTPICLCPSLDPSFNRVVARTKHIGGGLEGRESQSGNIEILFP